MRSASIILGLAVAAAAAAAGPLEPRGEQDYAAPAGKQPAPSPMPSVTYGAPEEETPSPAPDYGKKAPTYGGDTCKPEKITVTETKKGEKSKSSLSSFC